VKKPSKPAQRQKKQAPKARTKSTPKPPPATKPAPRKRPAPAASAQASAPSAQHLSEILFRRTFDAAPVATAIVGLDLTFTRANAAFCRLLGYTEKELLGKRFAEITHPDDVAAGRAGIEQLLTGKTATFDHEKRYLRKDGRAVWGQVAVGLIRDEANQPLFLVPIIQDITARKTAEAALQEREDRYQSLFISSLDAILLTIPNGQILAANPAACRLFERTEDEIKKTGRNGLVDTSDPRVKAAIQTRVKTGSFNGELTIIRKSGEKVPCEISSSLFTDRAGNARTSMTIRDISAHKQAELALQESEKRFQQITAAVTDYIYTVRVVDGRAVETIHGQGCLAITGYRAEEFTDDPFLWFCMVVDADRPMVERQARQILIGNEPAPIEHRILHKNGVVRWVRNTFVAHHDAHGMLISYEGLIQDITEHKQAEEALRVSEFRWKFAIEGAGDGLWDWDVTTNTVYYSKRWKEMLGYAEHDIKNDLGEWEKRIHPDDKAMVLEAAEAHRTGKNQSYQIEHRFRCKDGSWKWILAHGMAVSQDAEGKPLRVIGRHTDITEQKRTEQALRDSEQRYANTLTAVNDGLWEWHVPSGTAYFSPHYYAMLDYADQAFIANYTNWRALIHPDDVERVEHDLRQSVATGQGFAVDLRLNTQSGDWRWFSTRGNTVERTPDDQVLRMAGTLSDITQRKKAEEDLEEFFALVPDMVCIASADGFFLSLNDAWEQVLGYSKAELMAVPFAEFVHPDDRNTTLKESASQRTGKAALSFTNRYRAKNGTYHWFEWNATAANEKGMVFAAARDITDHKQAEEVTRESELRYRTLANSGQGLIWTAGLDKKCDYFNQTWLAFTGRHLEQELGDGWVEGVHPDDLAQCVETYVTAFDRRERFSMDYRIRRHDGEYRWIQDDGSPRYDSQGNFLGYIGHCLDITDRKQADDTLRETQTLYHSFIEQLPNAVFRKDREGRYVLVNSQFCQLKKLNREEIIGRTPVEIAAQEKLTQGDQGHATKYANEGKDAHVVILKTGKSIEAEEEYPNADGTKQYMHVVRMPILDASGNIIGTQGILFDITARKLAEDALRESEFTLRESQAIAGLGTYVTDIPNNTWRSSAVLNQLLGLKPAPVRPVEEWVASVHPEDRAMTVAYFVDHVVGQRQPFNKEYRIARQDDQAVRWVHGLGRLTFNDEGRPIEMRGTIQDITERKLADEALRTSENRFRGLFDLAVDGILIGSPDGACTEMNQQLCVLVGRSRDELLGKKINVLFTPEVLRETPLRWDLLEQGQPVKIVRPIKRPDGLEIIVEMHSKKMPDGSFQSFFHDVTAQTRAEAALRASEERFRDLLQNVSTVAVQGYRLDGTTSYWNRASELLYGYTSQEAIGHNLLDLIIPAEMQDGVRQAMRHMAETGQPIPASELSLRRKDGSRVAVFSSHSIVQLPGQPAELFCIDIDLTERKQAEAAIRESEEKFAKVFHDAPVWIAITDLSTGAYVDVNEEALRVSGFTRDEAINHTAAELGWISPENRAHLVEQLKARGQIDGMEMAFRTKDGRTVYGWFKGERIVLGGKPCLLTVTVETTERKRAEEALQNQTQLHAAELEQRVQERTAELEATNKELEAFSYSVSHDLRAPLRAIDGFSAILNTDFMSRLDKEGQRVLGIICAEAKRMGLLIDDLLMFSRMNRLPMQTGEIDMAALVKTVFDECAATVPDRQLQIKLQPLPTAQGDSPMIRQVLMNLIANAIKYTRPKPLAEIEIGGHQEGDEAVYYVKDNGVGFDQRYADKLFGVFQRLHTEDEFEGTGVGLALVQRVIHRHGGRVWAEAKVNEGATFHFTLPSKGR